ncbi:MAG: tRNA (N6-isopentenyl adenosine(37)-C2)-methylthiotransferase MiaB [Gammaproteobacteria bacterium]|nr:tRNA (N6-isopentenyl adenosine(37)-C2)-methylthiotransferase MiaB [Gammaproteobacteria bacterium]
MNLFIKTHGCQMNEYDSDRMGDLLRESHDANMVEDPAQADVILLNTCSIREKAQEKVFHELGRWRRLKKANPDLLIGVGGCVASQEGSAITARAPYVDIVFGPQSLHKLPEMLDTARAKRQPVVDISFPEVEKFDYLPQPHASGVSAYVTVMEGCSKYCSFCVVPYTRGPEVSRGVSDVMREIVSLASQGVREINLLGQNVNAYRGNLDGAQVDLAELIHYVGEIDGIERIRYTTSHPIEFSDFLINAYAEESKLVNHLHLPVQSGSDRILSAMKRGHTVLEYKSKIRKLRKIRPDIALSSDFIVGFPGETERDFEDTMQLVEELDFDTSFSFIYSARPGTPAADLHDLTPNDIKRKRLQRLQDQLRMQADRHAARLRDTVQTVLVHGPSKRNPVQWQGRTECNRVVNFDGAPTDDLVAVRIDEVLPNSLRGAIA